MKQNAMTHTQITDEASEWFVSLRYDTADAGVHDRFMEWLRTSPEHVRAYLGVVALWTDLPAVGAARTPDAQTLIERARAAGNVLELQEPGAKRSPTVTARLPRRTALAASIAFICLVAGATIWLQLTTRNLYTTALGEQRAVILPDGSRVQLNSSSRIRLDFTDKQRGIELLAGQALFRVAKDPQRPFVVRSDSAQIRAVGTQFDVYRRPDRTVVTVLEGRVAIRSLLLSAGEQTTVTRQSVSRPALTNLVAATAWTQGQLMFKSAPLSEVVAEFNRYNSRRLLLSGAIEDFPITAVFSSSDPKILVEFLQEQPGFNVEATEDRIVISPAARHP